MRRRAEPAWIEFAEWCRKRGLQALPAHPWTVAAFARWCERRMPAARIVRHVDVIARVHLLACQPVPDRHPTVRRTLRAIEARQAGRRAGAALFRPEDFVPSAAPAPKRRAATGGTPRRGHRVMTSRPKLTPRSPPRP